MKLKPLVLSWAVISCLSAGVAFATEPSKSQVDQDTNAAEHAKADNTKKNVRDRNDNTLTPIDQPNNERDVELAGAVRSAIVADDSLSTLAHNVKLVASDVLRGPVKSADEKAQIGAIVTRVAGVTKVDNQLEIAR